MSYSIFAIFNTIGHPPCNLPRYVNLLNYVTVDTDDPTSFFRPAYSKICRKFVVRILFVVSYLSEPEARSRAGGHFFMSNNAPVPPNNGAILNVAQIIKNVMSSATEAELGALYIMAKEAVYMRLILKEMGHKQPATPIQTDNSTAEGVVNSKLTPKRTKAMDMRFYWLRDRQTLKQF